MANKFTDAPWSDPESELSAEDYAKVCLIDLNPPGEPKTKAKLKLPIRKTPGGPIYINAMRSAAAALAGARGGVDAPKEEKAKAARKLIVLYKEAGLEPPESLYKIAGVRPK